jgi:Tol biopolymer transport system component
MKYQWIQRVGALGLVFFSFFLESCSKIGSPYNSGVAEEPYIDPHIIFTSKRWWNYDIYITDIYGGHMTHLTKNNWLDFNPAISSDGTKLAFVSDRDNGNREIYTVDLVWMDGYTQWEGRNLTNITQTSGHDWTPKFSPTHEKIVYTTYSPETDNYDVFLMNFDGSGKINLTYTPWYEEYRQFSPDGSFIIYQTWFKAGRGKPYTMEIFFSNLLDENNLNLTQNSSSHDIIPKGNAFSPDGSKIVFTSERDGNQEIYLMNIDNAYIGPFWTESIEQIRLTDHPAQDLEPEFSPDGRHIVFTSNRDGNREIYRMDADGGNLVNLTNNDADDWSPRYYPDNYKIIFQSLRDGPTNWEIYVMKTDGSRPTNLTNHPRTDYSFVVLPLQNP